MHPKLSFGKLSLLLLFDNCKSTTAAHVILCLMGVSYDGQGFQGATPSLGALWTSCWKLKRDRAPAMHFPTMLCRRHSCGGRAEEPGAEPRAAGEIFICGPAGCFLIDGCSHGGLRGGGEQLALHLTPCRMVEVTVQVRPDKWPLAQSPTHTVTRVHAPTCD